jgi:WD40 repeat protein
VKRELERIDVPGEHEARQRAWAVVATAFSERTPVPRSSHWPRVAAVAIAASALVAATLSPPGRAVLDEIRKVVGVERAQPALFSLPAPGRLLVASDAGVWVVSEDGSRRLLGEYREATWSPFGRYVAATRTNELAALEPDGDVRWTLPRREVRSASWAGTETDTKIAYADRTGVRVVAGDGTGDRLLLRGAAGLVAWQPGPARLLAVASPREIRVLDATSGRTIWRARTSARPNAMSWSPDGKRLLVFSARSLRVFDDRGRVPLDLGPGAAPIRAAALAPNGRAVAYVMETSGQSQLWIVPRIRPDANAARRLFVGTGELRGLTWSPDGRWLLVTWANSDQWLFIRADGRGIRAVSNIARQFRSASVPLIEGWCCTR